MHIVWTIWMVKILIRCSCHKQVKMNFYKLYLVLKIKLLPVMMILVFEQGILPDKMKVAKVIPLYKAGDHKDLCSYRPVSLLPQFSKVLETIISKRLLSLINHNNILYDGQYVWL